MKKPILPVAVIVVIILMVFVKVNSQEMKKNDFIGKWELNWMESGFFPKEDLLFVRTKKSLTQYVFELNENGTIVHKNNPNEECPVGEFTLKDGKWKFANNRLTLEMRGEKIADYWYWWVITYKVEMQEENMWLRVDKIDKNRMLPATATWEELIQQ